MLSEFRETFKSISNFELTGTYTIYQHNSNQSDHIRNLGWLISSVDLNITVSYLSSFMANVSLSSDNCSNFFIKTPDNHKVHKLTNYRRQNHYINSLYTRTLWIALAFQVATSLVDPFTRRNKLWPPNFRCKSPILQLVTGSYVEIHSFMGVKGLDGMYLIESKPINNPHQWIKFQSRVP